MKLKDMVKKVEQLNELNGELGLPQKAMVWISEVGGGCKILRTIEDYNEFKEQYVEGVKELLETKKFSQMEVKDIWQMCDIYKCGDWNYVVEFHASPSIGV